MGRVSKRGNSLRKTAGIHSEQNVKVRRYRAGIYARLSADHDERKNESVEVQIEISSAAPWPLVIRKHWELWV